MPPPRMMYLLNAIAHRFEAERFRVHVWPSTKPTRLLTRSVSWGSPPSTKTFVFVLRPSMFISPQALLFRFVLSYHYPVEVRVLRKRPSRLFSSLIRKSSPVGMNPISSLSYVVHSEILAFPGEAPGPVRTARRAATNC